MPAEAGTLNRHPYRAPHLFGPRRRAPPIGKQMGIILAEIVNFILAFFLWMLLGRFVLALLSGGRRTFFTELFEKATAPAIYVVRRITPSFVPDVHIPILALPLLLALRILIAPLVQPGP
ncbi:MAG TPA: hypothetical protein VFH48_39515 [Chloroflexota bacterium]|nr:hypothetical protein [Chloroflexota bacterium]